jgi:hypothetical protein
MILAKNEVLLEFVVGVQELLIDLIDLGTLCAYFKQFSLLIGDGFFCSFLIDGGVLALAASSLAFSFSSLMRLSLCLISLRVFSFLFCSSMYALT